MDVPQCVEQKGGPRFQPRCMGKDKHNSLFFFFLLETVISQLLKHQEWANCVKFILFFKKRPMLDVDSRKMPES